MDGDRVEEPVSLDTGAELIQVLDGGPLSNLPINHDLGYRVLDNG
jgi:hypothetical protein